MFSPVSARHPRWIRNTLTCLAASAVAGALTFSAATSHAGLDCGLNPKCGLPKPVAVKSATPLTGWIATAPGADFNRCVPDAANVLTRLNARGEVMGINYRSAGYTDLEGKVWHTQGVQRLPFYPGDPTLQGNWFVTPFSHPRMYSYDENRGAHLGVANLGFSAIGKAGGQIGTNRSYNRWWSESSADWNVAPNPSDTFVPVNGTPKFHMDDWQNHPGGLQTFGWHGAIPMQGYVDSNCWDVPGIDFCHTTPDDSDPRVDFYDFRNPQAPIKTSSFKTHPFERGFDARGVAVTRLADGRFLLGVLTSGRGVELFLSISTNPDDPNLFGNPRVADGSTAYANEWENINFITDCNGTLYLMGFGANDDADTIDLRPITLVQRVYVDGRRNLDVTLFSGTTKHMYCSDNQDVDQCDMKSGAGSYVDPQGHVVIYATSHANVGNTNLWWNYGSQYGAQGYQWLAPLVHGNGMPWFQENRATYDSATGFLPMVEFHERHLSGVCNTLEESWVEFYGDLNFNNHGMTSGRYYRVDYNVRDAKNGKDMGINNFNDTASSIRYCIPSGHSFRVYRDNWSGSTQWLNGTGQIAEVTDLRNVAYSNGGGTMNDSITSYHFHENYNDVSGWIGTQAPNR